MVPNDEAPMYLYDKHDYSVRECIDRLVPRIKVQADRPAFLEIGSGFHARYSGDLLYALFRGALAGQEPGNVEFHLVDPALYGYYSQIALFALEPAFGKIGFRTHPELWTAKKAQQMLKPPQSVRLNAAFALETTTLMKPAAMRRLHHDLHKLLLPGGYFLDVSEIDDKATSTVYKGLMIYTRSRAERVEIAKKAGFKLVASHTTEAHAGAVRDRQKMVGLLFRRRP